MDDAFLMKALTLEISSFFHILIKSIQEFMLSGKTDQG